MSRYNSISINLYQSLSISINLYQSPSISINLYQSPSISINLHQSLSISISLYQSLSISINLYQSPSISINLSISLGLVSQVASTQQQSCLGGLCVRVLNTPIVRGSIRRSPLNQIVRHIEYRHQQYGTCDDSHSTAHAKYNITHRLNQSVVTTKPATKSVQITPDTGVNEIQHYAQIE